MKIIFTLYDVTIKNQFFITLAGNNKEGRMFRNTTPRLSVAEGGAVVFLTIF